MTTNRQLPIAKAGEEIKAPELVSAKFVKASARIVKETEEPVIVLEFDGLQGNVLRTVKQAKGDLIDFYTKEQLEGMNPTLAVASYNRYFRNKDAQFKGSYHEVGAIQTVDENSKLYTNGLKEIGAKVETTSASVWVEGFISVVLSDAELDAIIQRELDAIEKRADADADLVP